MRRLAPILPYAAIAAILTLVHHRILFLGETFVLRDALKFTLPSREVLISAFHAGRFPEWLDTVGFGVAFGANPIHGALGPLGWMLAALPREIAVELHAFAHLLVAATGTAAFSRRLGSSAMGAVLAGVTLAVSGYVSSVISNGMAPIVAWTPWVAWAADRLARTPPGAGVRARAPELLVLSGALALQLLAGEPASVILTCLTALAVALARSERPAPALIGVAGAAALALALAAVAVVPSLSILGSSARAQGLTFGEGARWSMHPLRLVEWIWPLAFGAPGGEGWLARVLVADGPGEPCWSFSLALGAPVLLLAGVAARRNRQAGWLLATSAVFAVLAAGRYTPLYHLFRQVFPPEQLARYPEKYVYGALVLWSALAGLGFTRLFEGRPGPRTEIVAWCAALVVGGSVGLLGLARASAAAWLGARAGVAGIPLDPALGIRLSLLGGGCAAAGAALFAGALTLRRRRGWSLAPAVAAAGIVVPLVVASWATPLASRSTVTRVPALLAAVPRSASLSPPRVLRGPRTSEQTRFANGDELASYCNDRLEENVASRFGLDVVTGYDPGASSRSDRLWSEALSRMSGKAKSALLGVDYLLVEDATIPALSATAYDRMARSPDGLWLLRPREARPRAFVSPRWRLAPSSDAALGDLATPGREQDLALVTLVADEAPARSTSDGPLVPCAVERRQPEELALRCDTSTGGVAVLLDELAPGWTARVDGRAAPLLLADGFFRAVPVEPGSHDIVLRYRTPGLRAGAAVSFVSWTILAATYPFLSRRRRGARDAASPEAGPGATS